VVTAARAAGCTCQPEITRGHNVNGVPQFTAAHDDWCSLLRAVEGPNRTDRSQVVIYRPEVFGA
jgi:hypothetical protein